MIVLLRNLNRHRINPSVIWLPLVVGGLCLLPREVVKEVSSVTLCLSHAMLCDLCPSDAEGNRKTTPESMPSTARYDILCHA